MLPIRELWSTSISWTSTSSLLLSCTTSVSECLDACRWHGISKMAAARAAPALEAGTKTPLLRECWGKLIVLRWQDDLEDDLPCTVKGIPKSVIISFSKKLILYPPLSGYKYRRIGFYCLNFFMFSLTINPLIVTRVEQRWS